MVLRHGGEDRFALQNGTTSGKNVQWLGGLIGTDRKGPCGKDPCSNGELHVVALGDVVVFAVWKRAVGSLCHFVDAL